MSDYVIGRPDGAQIPIDSLPQNFVWSGNRISYIEVEYTPGSGNIYRQTFNYLTGRSVTGVSLSTGGLFGTYNGYILTGPGEGVVLAPVFSISGEAIGDAGTSYTNGDTLNIAVGTYSSVGQIQVTGVDGGGAITSAVVLTPGIYSAIPDGNTQPFDVTGGTGTGAKFNIQWTIASMTVVEEGSGYTVASGITFDTTGTLPSGTLTLTSTDVTSLDSISGWELQP